MKAAIIALFALLVLIVGAAVFCLKYGASQASPPADKGTPTLPAGNPNT